MLIFRKIRQSLLSKNKFRNYLLYAIGEIILVVIGILIAIQLNNINETSKNRDKELVFLLNLKEDSYLDVINLTKSDSLFATYESSSEKALQKFYKAKSLKDLVEVDSLFKLTWNNIEVNRKTYDELLNTLGIYIITNEKLRNQITDYYALIEINQQFIREINNDSQTLKLNPNLSLHTYLVNEYKKTRLDNQNIDTTWIGDFNSTYTLALYRFYHHGQSGVNQLRQIWHKQIIKSAQNYVKALHKN